MKALLLLLALCSVAYAHDDWINKGGHKNQLGELCCGDNDCAEMDRGAVIAKNYGYVIYGHGTITSKGVITRVFVDEIVPLAEGTPSPDGAFWRCQRGDKSRRCFFAPRPNS